MVEFLLIPTYLSITYLTFLNQLRYRLLLYVQVLILRIHGELRVICCSTFSYRYNSITNTTNLIINKINYKNLSKIKRKTVSFMRKQKLKKC